MSWQFSVGKKRAPCSEMLCKPHNTQWSSKQQEGGKKNGEGKIIVEGSVGEK